MDAHGLASHAFKQAHAHEQANTDGSSGQGRRQTSRAPLPNHCGQALQTVNRRCCQEAGIFDDKGRCKLDKV